MLLYSYYTNNQVCYIWLVLRHWDCDVDASPLSHDAPQRTAGT